MKYSLLFSMLLLAGCSSLERIGGLFGRGDSAPPVAEANLEIPEGLIPDQAVMRPGARPDGTIAATPVAIVAPPVPEVRSTSLGTTVASLGNPAEPGLWLKTPLVTSRQQGRVTAANGKSITATLIPIDGPETAGSRISLAALQALGLPLTGLPELAVDPL